jgi:cobalt-zinc-cadmium efflux system protein
MHWTGWLRIDPIVGLIIAVVILKGTWSLFADSFRLIIDGVPANISWSKVSEYLLSVPGVKGIHDLHIWAISTQENALSVHLYIPENGFNDEHRAKLVSELRSQFGIQHVTVQIEQTDIHCEDRCNPLI